MPAIATLSPLASLPEENRQTALERFRLIQPHLEEGHLLTQVAQQTGIPYRTAQRWVAFVPPLWAGSPSPQGPQR